MFGLQDSGLQARVPVSNLKEEPLTSSQLGTVRSGWMQPSMVDHQGAARLVCSVDRNLYFFKKKYCPTNSLVLSFSLSHHCVSHHHYIFSGSSLCLTLSPLYPPLPVCSSLPIVCCSSSVFSIVFGGRFVFDFLFSATSTKNGSFSKCGNVCLYI